MKLACFDLDNTLVYKGKITEENWEGLKLLKENGYYIALNTGRSINMCVEFFDNELVDYLICTNGSHIVNNKTKETLALNDIQFEDRKKFVKELRDRKIDNTKVFTTKGMFSSMGLIKLYLFSDKYKNDKYSFTLKTRIRVLLHTKFRFNVFKMKEPWLKVEWTMNTEEEMIEFIKYLNENYPVYVVNTERTDVELVSNKVGKGIAMLQLADLLNVDHKDTIAFGDSGNDIDMIQKAGYAVAMGNATDEIKNASDIVIGLAKESGIGKYLKERFGKKELRND